MSKQRRKKQGPIREERDRKPNPYWTMMDELEHEPIEDDYGEDSDAESVCGRQEHVFDPYKFTASTWNKYDEHCKKSVP